MVKEIYIRFSKKNYFILAVVFLSLSYLSLQIFNTYYSTLGVDEFWFAHWIYRYKDGIPYRDFSPYKTVLGYYILLLPMLSAKLFTSHFLGPLFFTKNTLACLNTLIFFISAFWLKKFFPKPTVLASIALIMCSEFVLSYSTNIRVDLLAYWFCLFSVLLLLEKKYFLSSFILALGFLTSQKALWYIAATNIAWGIYWLYFERDKKNFKNIICFNFSLIFIVTLYMCIWSMFSSFKTVLHNLFYEAYIMYQLDWYDSARKYFWTIILAQNPLPFLLWPLTLLSLIITHPNDTLYKLRFFCVIYASVIMISLIPYKQVFPYYMLTTLPAFLLLYAAFFSWLNAVFTCRSEIKILINKKFLQPLLFVYYFIFIYLALGLALPKPYWIILLIPILLSEFITSQSNKINQCFPTIILLIILFIGFIYPLAVFAILMPNKNGSYQKSVLNLAHQLLKSDANYLAGIELFYDKNQPIPGLRHLDSPQIGYLHHPTEKLRPVMMDSLYHAPVTTTQVLQSLQQSNIKFYINNYRMIALPEEIKQFLNYNYEKFWGSIYLYAPSIPKGKNYYYLKFSGTYQIQSPVQIKLNQITLQPNSLIELNKGSYPFQSTVTFRMKLIPNSNMNLSNEEDKWWKMLA